MPSHMGYGECMADGDEDKGCAWRGTKGSNVRGTCIPLCCCHAASSSHIRMGEISTKMQ